MTEPQRPLRIPLENDNRFAPSSTPPAPEAPPVETVEVVETVAEQPTLPNLPPVQSVYAAAPPTRAEVRPQVVAVRRGPGWAALIIGMFLTLIAALAVMFAVWGADSPFSAAPNMTDDSVSEVEGEVVEPVITPGDAPDWQAVAASVRPATVSIIVEGSDGSASGSGVIIDGQGHIVTNDHVVSGATEGGSITVTLHDGRLYNATIVGTDATTDLAVLRMENPPTDLTSALLGSSSSLAVGQPVMAIGAPLGLADTVTTGVISALDRPVAVSGGSSSSGQSEVVITNAIQIDASINPGNSGGPLFDDTGAVIGINSSIASIGQSSSDAGSIGLGFAIPVDLVKSIATQIIETGTVEHALLGVTISTTAVQVGEESRLGALVASVSPGGSADEAGLLEGDVIVGIDGNSVTSGPSLTGFVRRYVAGSAVVLDVVRDGQLQQVKAVLQAR
ncbi:S1C family serine protease [Actinomyces minihominis]|uniref:S1C family serine protease n=1 Tax=Actinomyces minihominis TaxID=2002838 RepID=UPI000C0748C3|nr:trypsin-like peptidase domain-containing protein [Actinomyces minihominis]